MAGQDTIPRRRQSLLPRRAASTATRKLAERTSVYAKGAEMGKTLGPMHESEPTPPPAKSSPEALVTGSKLSAEEVIETRVMNGSTSNGIAFQKTLVLPQHSRLLQKPSIMARTASTSSITNAIKPLLAAPAGDLRIRAEPMKNTSTPSTTKAATKSTITTRSATRKDESWPAASAVKTSDPLQKLSPMSRLPSYSLSLDHGIERRLADEVATGDRNLPDTSNCSAKGGNSRLHDHRNSVSVAESFGKGNVALPWRASKAQFVEHKRSKVHRPAFSTMQQHFTPKEGSKRLTRSRASSASGSQVANHETCDQDSTLQLELLRLHLLHRSVHMVQNQWLQSAEGKLRRRFEDLVPKHKKLRAAYTERQTRRNALALAAWISDSTGGQLTEKIRTLSWIIMEIDGFLDPAGKYMRVVTTFEEWFSWASEVLESRSSTNVSVRDAELRVIEGLGNPWKADVANLEAQLASYSTKLEILGPAHKESCLARILCLLESALVSMLEEMDNVRSIESDIMFQESDWLRYAVDALV